MRWCTFLSFFLSFGSLSFFTVDVFFNVFPGDICVFPFDHFLEFCFGQIIVFLLFSTMRSCGLDFFLFKNGYNFLPISKNSCLKLLDSEDLVFLIFLSCRLNLDTKGSRFFYLYYVGASTFFLKSHDTKLRYIHTPKVRINDGKLSKSYMPIWIIGSFIFYFLLFSSLLNFCDIILPG